jgi:flavin reductase (DIM6/NTAB) family NADH-FMN oxidoreductase RutF
MRPAAGSPGRRLEAIVRATTAPAAAAAAAATAATTAAHDDAEHVWWDVGSARPEALNCDPFLCALVPRPTAWLCVQSETDGEPPLLCLLDGYNASSDRPPTLMLAAAALPPLVLSALRTHQLCSVSVATPREAPHIALAATLGAPAATLSGQPGALWPATSFEELGLSPAPRPESEDARRPPAVASSPAQMDCRICLDVALEGDGQAMIVLQVDRFAISGEVLLRQAEAECQNPAALPASNPVSEHGLFEPFIYINKHFTEPVSGQT